VNAADFARFFEDLHGYQPFPWQARLAEEVCRANTWPDLMDLPTGSGKTACIDIALFHWLVCAQRGTPHDASRRVAFVVDRRIIVDEAERRARHIAEAIEKAGTPLLATQRALLEQKTSKAQIQVVKLRGGVEREENLARDPTLFTVVLSTVDQIGSRLLFRGYGVSDRMRPVHAGIFGVDTLLLLDEAHIAEPFQQTLGAIVHEQRRSPSGSLGPRALSWVRLSATAKESRESRVFGLAPEDRAHPVLARRLSAKKPMRLLTVEKRDQLPQTMKELVLTELAADPLTRDEAPRIGVVVNRVATARAIHDVLHADLKDRAEVELVIGRVRALDRDDRMAELTPKLRSDTSPRPGDRPIVVVATQTIEVGADFDFHVMFTEAASYAAVKQRVGRLNRLGARGAARGAVVLVREDATGDPVYADTTSATWALLEQHATAGVIDLGIEYAPGPAPGTAQDARATPILSLPLLDLLVQTQPRPAVEPSVSELLHGFATEEPDVSVVWRDGLTDAGGEVDVALAREVLSALPPLSREAMSLPFYTFRHWVSTAAVPNEKATKLDDLGDLDGDVIREDAGRHRFRLHVLVVSGEDVHYTPLGSVAPGAKVVLPTSLGGADRFGFAPTSRAPVSDLTFRARAPFPDGPGMARRGRTPTVVWTVSLARSWFLESLSIDEAKARTKAVHDVVFDDDAGRSDVADAIQEWFTTWREALRPDVVGALAAVFEKAPPRTEWLETNGERRGLVLRARQPSPEDVAENDSVLLQTVRVSLADHSRGVAAFAERFARSVGLAEPLVRALRKAGYVHDLGKADPRFQTRLRAEPGELLAKSDEYDRKIKLGERHEAYSVAVLDRHPELLAEHPGLESLIRYLVGTHHGFGRGFQPIVAGDRGTAFELELDGVRIEYSGRPGLGALGSDWADLFVELHRQYGAWGLAYLESILRLADHRRSEYEITHGRGEGAGGTP
jgi:CRISPR-associated endonuclease/helicase Cas3